MSMANIIGFPVKIDPHTPKKLKEFGHYSRVEIDVDLKYELLKVSLLKRMMTVLNWL